MKITYNDIMDMGIWDEFCDCMGYNHYFLREGRASSDDEVADLHEIILLGLKAYKRKREYEE